jgi:hypothetical protein
MSVDQNAAKDLTDDVARGGLRKRVDDWFVKHGVPQFAERYTAEDSPLRSPTWRGGRRSKCHHASAAPAGDSNRDDSPRYLLTCRRLCRGKLRSASKLPNSLKPWRGLSDLLTPLTVEGSNSAHNARCRATASVELRQSH